MNKVLIIIPNFGKGGAERVLSRILNTLEYSSNTEFTFVTLNYNLGYLLPKNISVLKLPHKRLLHAIPDLINIIYKENWSIIYSTLNHFNIFLPILTLFKKNTRLICRESILPITYYKTMGAKGALLLVYYTLVMRLYSLIIVQSNDMKNEIKKLGIKRYIKINNPSPNFKYKHNTKYLNDYIYIARWHNQKNYKTLINFWVWKFKKYEDKKKLLCIGVGEMAVKLNQKYNRFNINFIASTSAVEEKLRESRFYINFSKFEGFSNAILEALSIGLPVFSLEFLGGKEELLNKNNSILCPISSLKAAEKDFEEIYNNYINFQRANWQRELIKKNADKQFEMSKIKEQYEKIFNGNLIISSKK